MDLATTKNLVTLETTLIETNRIHPFQDGWLNGIPLDPGVYVFWDRATGKPKYVGETSSLNSRMREVGRRVNHTFPRKVAKELHLDAITDEALSAVISQRFDMSFIPVHFGRAELEEYLVLRWRQFLINKPAKRLLRSAWYQGVQPLKEWHGPQKKAHAATTSRAKEPVRK